ncbi:MAG: hypothetical protein Q8M40_00290 [Legionella sp.]|nr:hypothetical protein [Legionella sp.]
MNIKCKLDQNQKVLLVQLFLELNSDSLASADYSSINQILSELQIDFQVKKLRNSNYAKLDMQNQLMDFIYENISGEEFYKLLKDNYSLFDTKHKFNSNLDTGFDLDSKRAKNRAHFLFALQTAVYSYHDHEIKTSTTKALKETLLFCLLIVTIPFAKLFYNSRVTEHSKDNFFKKTFVESKVLDLQNKPGNSYGLINKSTLNPNQPFEKVIFSPKGNIRKFRLPTEIGSFRGYGSTFLGTKDQINRSEAKLEEASYQEYLKNQRRIYDI